MRAGRNEALLHRPHAVWVPLPFSPIPWAVGIELRSCVCGELPVFGDTIVMYHNPRVVGIYSGNPHIHTVNDIRSLIIILAIGLLSRSRLP